MKKLCKLLALLVALLLLAGCAEKTAEAVQLADAVLEAVSAAAEETALPPTEPTTEVSVETTVEAVLEISAESTAPVEEIPETSQAPPEKDGFYTAKADVCAYLVEYHRLPGNFITKQQLKKLGWEGGTLTPYAPGMSVGGDRFGNYEKLLPEGKAYRECDIDYSGGKRNAKRIIYAEDCSVIYYTADHYQTFTQLYPEVTK